MRCQQGKQRRTIGKAVQPRDIVERRVSLGQFVGLEVFDHLQAMFNGA